MAEQTFKMEDEKLISHHQWTGIGNLLIFAFSILPHQTGNKAYFHANSKRLN